MSTTLLEQIAEDVREIRNKLDTKANADAHNELEKRVRVSETKLTRIATIGMTLQGVFTAAVAFFGLGWHK